VVNKKAEVVRVYLPPDANCLLSVADHWASSDDGGEPDVVLACAGETPTLETVAAAALLREHLPELKVRVVNVVDLMRLQPESEHPHGHLVIDVIDRVPALGQRAALLRQQMVDERLALRAYTREHGDDPLELREWTTPA
jgi:phosphoketolase